MKERAFVIAAFGNRSKQVRRLIKNIRSYSDLPIHILTTEDSETIHYVKNIYIEIVERQWPKGSYREGVRNSNYHKINFALRNYWKEFRYSSLCLLDDDMYIVNPYFIDGFAIAEQFGAALPINPRVYNHYNMMGADVRPEDWAEMRNKVPSFIPAVNFSPFFVDPRQCSVRSFLGYLKNELQSIPCRGTVAIIKAMWGSKFTPVILPEQYCVCGSNAQYIKDYTKILKGKTIKISPIMLHLGHDEVRKVFADVIKEN